MGKTVKLTKEDFIKSIAEKTGMSKKDATLFFNAFVETVKEELKKKREISIRGFGRFLVKKRKERRGRNPRTGEEIVIPAKEVPAFVFSKKFWEE